MMNKNDHFIPALGLDALTPLYDLVLNWVFQEARFKQQLVNQANIQSGQRVLDLGCGTGTLTLLIKQAHPDADVIGLDGDFTVLTLARAKAERADVPLALHAGMAFQLPYPDQAFDRVLTSLVLHHLTTENKQRTLHEVYRVLQPGSALYVHHHVHRRSALCASAHPTKTIIVAWLRAAGAADVPRWRHACDQRPGRHRVWVPR
jgi:ubiquinone/menaquinone biosynthesis C-methylase UbiE